MTGVTSSANLASLRAQLTGAVLTADLPGWAEEVSCFNSAVTHCPDLVVAAATPQDVQAAMRYAAAHDLPVAVQATGHGAQDVVADGLLVSTRHLDELSIDSRSRLATIGAGVRWRAVIDVAAGHGLAPLNGSSSDVGAVGYTLGGGMPVMGRAFGYAADRVRSLEVVTADGQLRHVDADTEPDLFWGLRGGAGNLGIVTSMTMELVPVTTVHGGAVFYPAAHIPAVLHAYQQWVRELPETMSTSVAILRLPPAPEIPESLRGQTLAHLRVCGLGGAEETERLLAPMRDVAPTVVDSVADMPYTGVDAISMDPDHPVPFVQNGLLLGDLTAETVDALLTVVGPEQPTPLLLCELRHLGGAFRRAPKGGNAVGGRDAEFALFAVGVLAPEIADVVPGAVAAVIAAAEPWATGGTFVNLTSSCIDEAGRARAWDAPAYQRLLQLVERYDPAGLMCRGHAIGRQPVSVPGG